MSTTTNSSTMRSRTVLIRHLMHPPRLQVDERERDWRYPISRWYLRPAAGRLAASLAPTRVRPVHLTACGLLVGTTAAAVLWWRPDMFAVSAALVLAAWFFDRADGQLARRQNTASRWGAWADANVDELLDVLWHVAAAAAAQSLTASAVPWYLLVAFLGGKYLFMHGLADERHLATETADDRFTPVAISATTDRVRWAYHLPGNADIRVHLLVLGLATGWLTAELALVAVYYNLRWVVRYVLVFRRLGGIR